MSLIGKKLIFLQRSIKLDTNKLLTIQKRAAGGYWNKDFKPGPYPVTEEQKVAAAKRYGLRRDEYEPYPDDGMGLGDYPKLPYISDDSKDPNYDYDFPEFRRNYGEPIHMMREISGLDRFDISKRERYTGTNMVLTLLAVCASFYIFYIFVDDWGRSVHWPVMPKQMPEEGKVHYTFEPAE